MKRILAMLACAAFGVSTAAASGVNLSWNDCGDAGTMAQTFTCDSNSGAPFVMYGSFVPPVGVDEFLGLSAQVDICTMTPFFTDWWAHGTGRCRGTGALSTTFNFTSGPFYCADFYTGQAAGGYAYDVGFGDVDRARLRIQCAVPFENRGPVDSSTEYYAFQVNILRTKTTGAGSCAGCSIPACIILNSIQLFQPAQAGFDPILEIPVSRNFMYWQGPVVACPAAVPVKSASWGQIKSLFR